MSFVLGFVGDNEYRCISIRILSSAASEQPHWPTVCAYCEHYLYRVAIFVAPILFYYSVFNYYHFYYNILFINGWARFVRLLELDECEAIISFSTETTTMITACI